jgi:hypothetical protein
LYLNRRKPQFFSGIKLALKNYHQQEAPVPRQSLDSHPGTLPSEKVMTQARIGIGYSDEEWDPTVRRCRQALHQDPEFFRESFGAKPPGSRASIASTRRLIVR